MIHPSYTDLMAVVNSEVEETIIHCCSGII